jgi:hypothetical protein
VNGEGCDNAGRTRCECSGTPHHQRSQHDTDKPHKKETFEMCAHS